MVPHSRRCDLEAGAARLAGTEVTRHQPVSAPQLCFVGSECAASRAGLDAPQPRAARKLFVASAPPGGPREQRSLPPRCFLNLHLVLIRERRERIGPKPPLFLVSQYHVVKKCWKFRKKSCTRKARRDCREEGKGTDDLASSLQSHLGNDLHGGRLHQPLREDAPDEKFQSVCARADRPRRQPLEDSFVTASSSLVSHAPSTEHVPPVASTLSPGLKTFPVSLGSQPALSAYHPPEPPIPPRCLSPQPLLLSPPPSYSPSPMASRPPLPDPSLALPQQDSSPLPLGAIPQNLCPPNNCWLSSPEPETSILGDTGCPISALSQCQEPPGALCHSNLSNSECQGGHLTPQSPEASVLPETAYTQVQVGSSYFLNPDVQKVLDTLIKKKVEQIYKNTEEEGQNIPLYSLGNMLSSLGKEQDLISPQAFWKTRCKAEQLSVSQELFYPKVLWDHLQQKCSQLFWGLPTLHSESLMDNIRASGASLEVSPIVFNGLHNSIPVQIQANAPLQLLSSQPLVHYVAQSQTLTPTMPSSQTPPQKQTQVHVPPLPIVPCSSPPVRAWEVSCPTKKKGKKYSISPTIQHLQDKLLKEERENRRVLPPVAKKSQQVVSQSTDKHWASQENINFPVNIIQSKLREQLEQHFQKNHMCELPQKTHLSLGLTGLREKYPGTRQAKENSGPSQTSEVSDKSSQVIQKFRSGHPEISQEGKYSSNDLGQVLKGLSEIPKNSPVNDLESMSEGGSETNKLRPSRSDSGYDSARGPDKKHLEDSVFMETEQKSSDWAVTKGASVMSTSQNLNVSLKSLKSLRSNKSLPSSKISTFQDPGDSCLGTQAKSKNQNQTEDSATGVLLLDFATGKVPQGSASEFLLTEDILASQTSLL
ncbi:spermatogenesis-associated protein 31A6-like, partial [Heterocephalus glaber]|uniref:Spermatogenesis-associated protein 31A6-like n=1 Tax=Heterocephalus glaber TaxID=10181 RepID=A0AAX6RI70_HETGA